MVPIDWTQQLSAHRGWLEKVVRCRLGSACDAEDVLQELALSVLPHPNRPTDPEKVAPWLYRLTLRKVINLRRTLMRRRKLVEQFGVHVQTTQTLDQQDEGADRLLRQESIGRISLALNQLDEREREILTLKYAEGWSYRELANHLGVTEKTIEYRLLKARNQLASRMGRPEIAKR